MKKYIVIGGQYKDYCYGEFDSLHAAKMCATKNAEYWDNWQGWHTPKIYKFTDCYEYDGVYYVFYDTPPYAQKIGNKWEIGE